MYADKEWHSAVEDDDPNTFSTGQKISKRRKKGR
jgi:hypothetical protein